MPNHIPTLVKSITCSYNIHIMLDKSYHTKVPVQVPIQNSKLFPFSSLNQNSIFSRNFGTQRFISSCTLFGFSKIGFFPHFSHPTSLSMSVFLSLVHLVVGFPFDDARIFLQMYFFVYERFPFSGAWVFFSAMRWFSFG